MRVSAYGHRAILRYVFHPQYLYHTNRLPWGLLAGFPLGSFLLARFSTNTGLFSPKVAVTLTEPSQNTLQSPKVLLEGEALHILWTTVASDTRLEVSALCRTGRRYPRLVPLAHLSWYVWTRTLSRRPLRPTRRPTCSRASTLMPIPVEHNQLWPECTLGTARTTISAHDCSTGWRANPISR